MPYASLIFHFLALSLPTARTAYRLRALMFIACISMSYLVIVSFSDSEYRCSSFHLSCRFSNRSSQGFGRSFGRCLLVSSFFSLSHCLLSCHSCCCVSSSSRSISFSCMLCYLLSFQILSFCSFSFSPHLLSLPLISSSLFVFALSPAPEVPPCGL